MKLFAWTIIAFRELENGDVSYGDYLCWSEAKEKSSVEAAIEKTKEEMFPVADGWFDHHHGILEIPNR